jgi:hypothetical protein
MDKLLKQFIAYFKRKRKLLEKQPDVTENRNEWIYLSGIIAGAEMIRKTIGGKL